MSKIDDLIKVYKKQVSLPWNQMLSPQEKVWFCIYDPTQERRLQKQLGEFEIASQQAGHEWISIDITDYYEEFLSKSEYKEKYFKNPNLIKFEEKNFFDFLATKIQTQIQDANSNTIISLIGIGSLFGIVKISKVIEYLIKKIDVYGRLLVFFPGEKEGNNYRLLKARDGWNYLATPIVAEETE